jgi:signal recognition particle subunit SRP54
MAFEEAIGMDGFIMTKLDGDARGGAALSIRKMTGKPIKYICVGEKIDKIEVFHPDRMADRILGMGDVMSLIEKASANIDQEEAAKSLEKMMSNKFDLNDLLSQFEQMKKMGSMKDIIGLVPGVAGKVSDEQLDEGEVTMNRNIAIIRSMTNKERKNPNILNASRRKRIAAGSGTTVQDVNNLIRQYDQSAKLMKQMGKGGFKMPKGFPGGKFGGLGGFGKRGLF